MASEKKARIIRALLLIIVIVCLAQIAGKYYLSIRHKKQQEKLSNYVKMESFEQDGDSLKSADSIGNADYSQDSGIHPGFEELYSINSDIVGWLSIDGTEIDYPVVQCEDEEYYLTHDFYGNEDKYGCLFVRDYAKIDPPGTNIIIYGHSMRDGSMFGNLDEYKSEKYYKAHPVIDFDTLYEERTYEVMAVFQSKVYGEDEDVFKYYQFYEADTEEDFLYFYNNVKKLSIYDTGVTAEYGDTFITLSTCSYHTEEGRFVVVAKLSGNRRID